MQSLLFPRHLPNGKQKACRFVEKRRKKIDHLVQRILPKLIDGEMPFSALICFAGVNG
jgi:hypothetical protein